MASKRRNHTRCDATRCWRASRITGSTTPEHGVELEGDGDFGTRITVAERATTGAVTGTGVTACVAVTPARDDSGLVDEPDVDRTAGAGVGTTNTDTGEAATPALPWLEPLLLRARARCCGGVRLLL